MIPKEKQETTSRTDMGMMFCDCKALQDINISSFDTSLVEEMRLMFENCYQLTTIYASYSFNTDNVSSSYRMFKSCANLRGGNGTAFNSSYLDKTYARIDTSTTPGYFTITQ